MNSSKKSLNAGQIAVIMIVLTAVSKVFGFLRELLLANYFGAGPVVDAYSMAQDIPDTVFATVIQIVGTAYLPLFSRKSEQEGLQEADLFTSRVYNFLLTMTAIMIAVCILFPDTLLSLFAPGFSQETVTLARYYLRVAVFMLIGHVSVAIFEPYLRYKGSYLSPILFGFFQSVFVIVFTLFSAYTAQEYLIYGVPVGTIMQGLCLILFARRKQNYRYFPDFRFGSSLKEVFALSLPILVSSLAVRLNAFFDRMLASGFDEGSISALRYGHLIMNLISAFSYTIIGTIAYPKFNKYAAQGDYESLGKEATQGNIYTAMLTLPLTFGGMLFCQQIVRFVYERGAFDSAATLVTASVFFWYVLAIPIHGVNTIVSYVFFSLKDIKTTVYCSMGAVAVNTVLNFILSHYMGVQGLALATTVAAALQTIALVIFFCCKYGEIHVFGSARLYLLTFISAAVSTVAAFLVYRLMNDNFISFVICVVIAVTLYFLLMLMLKVLHVSDIKSLFKRAE